MMENVGLELLMERDEINDINVVDDLPLNEVDFGKYLSSPLPTNLVNKDLTLDKSMLLNLALDALNELLKLAMSDEPFWVRSLDGGGEILNMKEYARSFIPIIGIKPSHFTIEATRSFGTVVDNSRTLVEMLMNESQWVDMFPCIIGKVNTFDVISIGVGESKSGTLLLVLGLLWMCLSTQSKKVSNNIKLKNVEGSLLVALFKICLMVTLRLFGSSMWNMMKFLFIICIAHKGGYPLCKGILSS